MNLCEGIENAIVYIEQNLTEKLDFEVIASKAYISNFYFQKIFGVLCGMTLGEYIRCRRLAEAGNELCATHAKVIDIALKYGYDSPDSFTKAFTKFHGITPSSARQQGATLKSFAPLHIKLTLEGGDIMDYRIEQLEEMVIIGKKYRVNYDNAYSTIPNFWLDYLSSGLEKLVKSPFGVCVSNQNDKTGFDYYIGDLYNAKSEIPEGFELYTIPAYTWSKFTCKGKLPTALQEVNTKIWSQWVPTNKEFELASSINIEMYTDGNSQSDDYISEIWVPVKRK